MIVGVKLEFDITMDIEDNDSDTYKVWDYNADTYNCFRVHYDEFAEIDNVTVTRKEVFVTVKTRMPMRSSDGDK